MSVGRARDIAIWSVMQVPPPGNGCPVLVNLRVRRVQLESKLPQHRSFAAAIRYCLIAGSRSATWLR